jgi:hypothetical protein
MPIPGLSSSAAAQDGVEQLLRAVRRRHDLDDFLLRDDREPERPISSPTPMPRP